MEKFLEELRKNSNRNYGVNPKEFPVELWRNFEGNPEDLLVFFFWLSYF